MYIEKVLIENIKGIKHLELNFDEPAGWHVLIGDNASGKTTIMRVLSLLLIGEIGAKSLYTSWNEWLKEGENNARVDITTNVKTDLELFDKHWKDQLNDLWVAINEPKLWKGLPTINLKVFFEKNKNIFGMDSVKVFFHNKEASTPYIPNYEQFSYLYFSAGYGSFRRLTGETPFQGKEENSNEVEKKVKSHISIFDERYGLIDVVKWLKHLKFQQLENKPEGEVLNYLFTFLNNSELLPHGVKIYEVNSDNIFFKTIDNHIIDVFELSDGYRTILATFFDIIHKMLFTYKQDFVFEEIKKGNILINLEGVVLIDEVDAHLHPTWQARIGEWFTKYFPKVQFIVTTHSPIICRAAVKGSIWKLCC